MIARLAAMAITAYLYAASREWRTLYSAECARAVEQQRALDRERADVDRLTEELGSMRSEAVQEQHLRNEIEALEVAVKVLAADAATAQAIARTTTALAETKMDTLIEAVRERRATTSDDAARSTACRNYDPERTGAHQFACRVCEMIREDHRPATEPTPWSTMRSMARDALSAWDPGVAVEGLATALREAADRGQHAVETASALIAAVDAVLEWRNVACRSPAVMRDTLDVLWRARAAVEDGLRDMGACADAPPMPITRREVRDDDLVNERYGIKIHRADALKRYHAERITLAEDSWMTIGETQCPVCEMVDDVCIMKKALTVDDIYPPLGALTRRYHVDRINAAEQCHRGICEVICPTCLAVDVPCFPHGEDAPTVDHG